MYAKKCQDAKSILAKNT